MCPLHSSTTTKTKLSIHEKQNLSFNHNPQLKSIKTDNMGCLLYVKIFFGRDTEMFNNIKLKKLVQKEIENLLFSLSSN